MHALAELPCWALALLIFVFRIVDVSLGTVRTISVVEGRIRLSVVLGFFEVLVWITAVSQAIAGVKDSPLLLVAYAAGYAAGNAAGILLERRMALGTVVVRFLSTHRGEHIAAALRRIGQPATTFEGRGRQGSRVLVYATCARRDLKELIAAARSVDPDLFYVVERVSESSRVQQLRPRRVPSLRLGWLLAGAKRK